MSKKSLFHFFLIIVFNYIKDSKLTLTKNWVIISLYCVNFNQRVMRYQDNLWLYLTRHRFLWRTSQMVIVFDSQLVISSSQNMLLSKICSTGHIFFAKHGTESNIIKDFFIFLTRRHILCRNNDCVMLSNHASTYPNQIHLYCIWENLYFWWISTSFVI